MKATLTKAGAEFPRSRRPIAAIVLTFLGGLVYSQAAAGFFIIGFVGISAASLPFTVFFLSDTGVIGCVVMMALRPKRHLAWGVSVLLFTALALVVDGSFLVGFYEASPLLGIIWTAPLILVVLGGILAAIWKPPADPSTSSPNEIVQ